MPCCRNETQQIDSPRRRKTQRFIPTTSPEDIRPSAAPEFHAHRRTPVVADDDCFVFRRAPAPGPPYRQPDAEAYRRRHPRVHSVPPVSRACPVRRPRDTPAAASAARICCRHEHHNSGKPWHNNTKRAANPGMGNPHVQAVDLQSFVGQVSSMDLHHCVLSGHEIQLDHRFVTWCLTTH